MKAYKEIQDEINIDFDNYLTDLLKIDGEPRKYFYWSLDFFKTVDNLSFQYFTLTNEQKDEINKIGISYFNSESTYFQVNKNSHRHDLLIKNINKLFANSSVSKQSNRYEYLKEFIFWQILEKLSQKGIVGSEIVKQQKKNYLITYITFLIQNTDNPTFKAFKSFKKYNITKQGENLLKKLDELDSKNVENKELRIKINNLYILKKYEDKIHFVFSRNGGGEKEELRELLEIMGKEDTGNLYRGQANSFWNLDASITRDPTLLENERDMYYDILSLKPDAFRNDKSVYERLITMQHYGMPTRLLDVTRNPLVAIFFACNNLERKNSDGIIFTFKPQKSKFLNFEDKKIGYLPVLFGQEVDEDKKKINDFLSKIWFFKGIAKNQRINNQSGDFIFAGNGDEAKKELHGLPKMSIIIDSKTKRVLIEQLASLNIHGGAVYPDLAHISRYIIEKYKNEKTLNKEQKISIEENKQIKPDKKSDKSFVEKDVVPSFSFDEIKEKDNMEKLKAFAMFYELNLGGLDLIIQNINFTKKQPLRDEVVKIMNKPPSLKERAKIVDALILKIIALADLLHKEKGTD